MLFEALSAAVPILNLAGRIRQHQKRKSKAVAKRLHKYVDPCMERYNDPAYCWRVAWNIYCSNVNPRYPGCTKYGRRWGLSRKPLSRRRSRRKRR